MKNDYVFMKKTLLKFFTIFAVLLGVVFACQELDDGTDENFDSGNAIENAKNWYERNKPATVGLRSSNGTAKVLMKPEWKNVFTMKNNQYEVVETELMSQGRVFYFDKACMEKYKETKDPKYKQCYVHLVFQTNRETGDTVAFLMTMAPNLEWLEKSNFKPFKKMNYLKRDKGFGGTVLFHELDGSFSNGWVYENGQIIYSIESMDSDQEGVSLRSCSFVDYYSLWETCTYWFTVTETQHSHTGTTCSYAWEYSHTSLVCTNDGTWGGYSGGAGNGSTDNGTSIQARSDCSEMPTSNANHVQYVVANEDTDYEKVKPYIETLRSHAAYKPHECAMAIDFLANQYYIGKDENGKFITESSSSTSVSVIYGKYTVFGVHTHPSGTNSAPSPSDASFLVKAYIESAVNIQGNIVLAANGSEYIVYVSDRFRFTTFCKNADNAGFFECDGSQFQQNSVWRKDYDAAYNSIKDKGLSINDAQSYALSYVLSKYNTGMVIMSRNQQNGDFKEQKTILENKIYKLSKCP